MFVSHNTLIYGTIKKTQYKYRHFYKNTNLNTIILVCWNKENFLFNLIYYQPQHTLLFMFVAHNTLIYGTIKKTPYKYTHFYKNTWCWISNLQLCFWILITINWDKNCVFNLTPKLLKLIYHVNLNTVNRLITLFFWFANL